MAFNFGGIRTTQSLKKVEATINPLLFDHEVKGENGYNVLVPYQIGEALLRLLRKEIESAGIKSYRIIATCNVRDPGKKTSTKDKLKTESNWDELLLEYEHDYKYKMILTVGEAMYVLNRSADFDAYPFIDDIFDETKYVAHSDFLKVDAIVYPTYPIKDWFPLDNKDLKNKTDFVNWMTKVGREQLRRMLNDDKDASAFVDARPYEVVVVDSIEETKELFGRMMNSDILAFDLETTGLSFLNNKIGCLTLCNDGIRGYYVPWDFVEKGKLKRILLGVLTSAKRLVGHNSKFDAKFLWQSYDKSGCFYPTDDTMMLIHCIHTERNQGLKPAAYFYTYFGGYDNVLDEVKEQLGVESYMDIPKQFLTKYAAIDAIATWRILVAAEKRAKWIDSKYPNYKDPKWGIWRWYTDVAMPMFRDTIDCEYEGLYVDRDELEHSRADLRENIAGFKKKLVDIWNAEYKANIDEKFDFASVDKLGDLLCKMGWPAVKLNKKKRYATDEDCFAEWKRLGYKGVQELTDLRSNFVALNSFVGYVEKNKKGVEEPSGWEQHIVFHDSDGRYVKGADRSRRDGTWRMHPSINCMGTNTFRHSIQNPSMQNIPTTGNIGSICKRVISVPDVKKYKLCTSDYVSLQMILVFQDCACVLTNEKKLSDGIMKKPEFEIDGRHIDKIMKDIYGKDGDKDAHTHTMFSVFLESINAQVYDVDCESGKKFLFHEKQLVKTETNELEAKRLKVDDVIVVKDQKYKIVKLSHRSAKFEDALNLKKEKPCETYRIYSKGINFGSLFGAGPNSLARRLRVVYGFTEKDCDDIIELMGLQNKFDELVSMQRSRLSKFGAPIVSDVAFLLDMKYLCIAKEFRGVFFDTYPALDKRLRREKTTIVQKNFEYMQSWKGPKRRLPEIRYMSKNSKNNLVGADKELWSRSFAELGNIAGNTDAQLLEAYHAFTLWHNMHTNLKEWGFKSRVFNGTHDSLDKFIHEDETEVVVALENFVAALPTVPFFDLPLEIEADLADVSSHEARKNTFYKHGNPVKPIDFFTALKNYNEEHGTDLKWHNTLPDDYVTTFPKHRMIISRKGYTNG